MVFGVTVEEAPDHALILGIVLAHFTRFGRNIYAITKYIVIFKNDFAKMNTDAQFEIVQAVARILNFTCA